MKKPFGWRHEPARHALASKGIETKIKERKTSAPLALPPQAMKSGTPVIKNEVKAAAVDRILQDALTEGGSKSRAIELLEDDRWLKGEVEKIVEAETDGLLQRSALRGELLRSIRKNPPVSDEEE